MMMNFTGGIVTAIVWDAILMETATAVAKGEMYYEKIQRGAFCITE